MMFAAVHESARVGPLETSDDVRCSVASGGEPDIDAFCPDAS